MKRSRVTFFALLFAGGCGNHYAEVLVPREAELGDTQSSGGAGGDTSTSTPLDEPRCHGTPLDETQLREHEILLGRLMTFSSGSEQEAQTQAPLEVARYFGTDTLLLGADQEELAPEFLETLTTTQRDQLAQLANSQEPAMTEYRAAKNALIETLWGSETPLNSDQITRLSTDAGRTEGELALSTLEGLEELIASLSGTQSNQLRAAIERGDQEPAIPISGEVRTLLDGPLGEEISALATKAYAWLLEARVPTAESRRKIAPFFGYAYFALEKESRADDGAEIRAQLALDIWAHLDAGQRDLVCETLAAQEGDLEAYQATRSSFVSSVLATPAESPDLLLALHATLGSNQGRVGYRQANLLRTIVADLSAEQFSELANLYQAHNATPQ